MYANWKISSYFNVINITSANFFTITNELVLSEVVYIQISSLIALYTTIIIYKEGNIFISLQSGFSRGVQDTKDDFIINLLFG